MGGLLETKMNGGCKEVKGRKRRADLTWGVGNRVLRTKLHLGESFLC